MAEHPCDLIVLRHGELFLKGGNRASFESLLTSNVRRALNPLPDAVIQQGQGRLFVSCAPARIEEALDQLKRVFGLSSLSPAVAVPQDLEAIGAAAVELAAEHVKRRRPSSFRVKAKRSDKRFPTPSPEIGRLVGERVWERIQLPVNLVEPELTVGVEVGPVRSFVYVDRIPGAGGLPVGSSGRAALLLSGGIYSPVAGYLMQKRGCVLTAVYFHSPPYTGARTRAKVEELAGKLAPAQGGLTLHVVSFTAIQTAIRDGAPCEMAVVLYRRAMMRIASALSQRSGCLALVTGENLGQVASQTLENMICIEQAAALPVLRPLLTYDKAETIELARRVGTYELSTLPYEDCCSLFVPRHPLTRARSERVEEVESHLALSALMDQAIAGAEAVSLPA